ncbi:hypothetical protein HCX60_00970 [Streptomyces antibioticus]|uniref:Uncharacterized protein n=1 Tax=Streptomyces antibioticus TaxID=1890 RepID=A0AAE6Y2S3_STRAT|nr:hypothetical protein HCX60_00970 [Streptomyces antibioticus]
MAVGQCAGGVVRAVVVYDGRVLLVAQPERWGLPAGVPCQLLSESPSGGGSLARAQVRWVPLAEAVVHADVPGAVRSYLRGHMPA